MNYDEQRLLLLVKRARNGDSHSFDDLLRIFEPELKIISQRLYIDGADYNDVLQETRIGLWNAVKDYRDDAGTSFHNFAINVCCKRRVYTSIKASNGKKYRIHNKAESLDRPIITEDDDGGQTLADFIVDNNPSPLELLIGRCEYNDNVDELRGRMTDMESNVFESFTKDHTYQEIGTELDITQKAADNALMRIRKKASKIFHEYNADTLGQTKQRKRKNK